MNASSPVKACLELKNIGIQFGGLKVLENINFSLPRGGLYGLIGPNGAGKTTAFNLISGIYRPTRGEIRFDGEALESLGPAEVCKLGIVRTFQNIRLFSEMTVLENILVAMHKDCAYGVGSAILNSRQFMMAELQGKEKALELLQLFDLKNMANEQAGSLPYGQQRKLEIVRALASQPKLLLLDEPAAGMNHSETESLMALIKKIRSQFSLTVLLIEHDMKLVMGICEKIFVLDHGIIIAEGAASEIQKNQKVIEAYLGVDEPDDARGVH